MDKKSIKENIKTNILFVQFLLNVRVEVRRMGILCVEEYIIILLKKLSEAIFSTLWRGKRTENRKI